MPVWKLHRHIGMGGDQLVGAVAGEEAEQAHGDDARDLVADWTTSADVEHTKPAPDIVEVARARLGDGRPAVMVGDTTWDCVAAGRAGVPAIGVLTGGFAAAELRDAGAVAVYEGARDLSGRLDAPPIATRPRRGG